ncbi:hypothetical protein JYU34_021198 [Plutella xylostella]|uniref:Cuticle protein n=1 Tax=Plutella xylostella TaxID=51655 RepID=A0ABQ7PTJ0_PLUXY|nr:hypothetical protein JYU34_021198 [Plutella xylostella]
MFGALVIFACLALTQGHPVVPYVVPTAHLHPAPVAVAPYPVFHHGYPVPVAKYLSPYHHILKRSPHYAAALAPVAVSHQSRVDVHTSPALAPVLPVVKPYYGSPLLHKAAVLPVALPYGHGLHYGSVYPHLGHY